MRPFAGQRWPARNRVQQPAQQVATTSTRPKYDMRELSMELSQCRDMLSNDVLMDIIDVQTEIVKLGIDLSGVMDFVVDKMLSLTNSSGAIIELMEQDDMVYRAASGGAKKQLGLRLSKATSLSGLCIENRQTLKCDDSETDARVDREACRKVGLRSMVVAPLFHLETVVGALKIFSDQPSH